MENEIDKQIGAMSAVMWTDTVLHCSVEFLNFLGLERL